MVARGSIEPPGSGVSFGGSLDGPPSSLDSGEARSLRDQQAATGATSPVACHKAAVRSATAVASW
jgi:hypothetical protein